jgi:hypothetical protein
MRLCGSMAHPVLLEQLVAGPSLDVADEFITDIAALGSANIHGQQIIVPRFRRLLIIHGVKTVHWLPKKILVNCTGEGPNKKEGCNSLSDVKV